MIESRNLPKLNMAMPRPASEIIFTEYFTKLGIPIFHLCPQGKKKKKKKTMNFAHSRNPMKTCIYNLRLDGKKLKEKKVNFARKVSKNGTFHYDYLVLSLLLFLV